MIVKMVVGAVVAASAAGVVAYSVRDASEPVVQREAGIAAAAEIQPAPVKARATREDVELARARWAARKDGIREAHARARATAAKAAVGSPSAAESDDEDCIGMCTDEECLLSLATQVSELVSACDELATAAPADATLTAHIIGAPDIGAVVESVQLEGEGVPAELGECLTESMYSLELANQADDFEQDITVMLQNAPAAHGDVAWSAKSGELVEVTGPEIESVLAGAGIGELPEGSSVYVMGAEPGKH